jgi:PIN domain nuclease of toxin-antitoxin system
VLLWWLADEHAHLTASARKALSHAPESTLISAVSVWEIAIKRGLGKLEAPDDLLDQLESAHVPLLSISARHADRAGRLPPHHRDPFDRLLVAQALTEGAALISADAVLAAYGVDVVW